MDSLDKVTDALDAYCVDKINLADTIDARYTKLWQEIHRYLMNGGKRMRPRLVLLAHHSYSETAVEAAVPVAAAWELLHACLLVHDDIIDRDLLRHGQQNLAGRYQEIYRAQDSADREHYALSAALLGGDLLLMSTYELLTKAPLSSEKKLQALSYINKAVFAVAGGELIDTDAVLYPVSETNPYTVATYKTASYSLQFPLQSGAALAGASTEELDKLHIIGMHAGIAYQLRDDLLGVFGDSSVTGKSNRSDIVEKKRTLLIHKTLEMLAPDSRERLLDLFAPAHVVNESEAEEIVALITSSGARDVVQQTIESESAKALKGIDTLRIADSNKEAFIDIVSSLTTRTK